MTHKDCEEWEDIKKESNVLRNIRRIWISFIS